MTLSYGHWGPSSFEPGGDWCATTISGREALVITRIEGEAVDIVVWYIFHGLRHNPLLHVHAESGNEHDLALQVAYSAANERREHEP